MLETIARIPYFAYISILHLYESLGFWRAGAELRKVGTGEERSGARGGVGAAAAVARAVVTLFFGVCRAVPCRAVAKHKQNKTNQKQKQTPKKVHFAEEWNELHHLQIMESLGGDQLWLDRFIAEHSAIVYYWLLIAFYLFSPR